MNRAEWLQSQQYPEVMAEFLLEHHPDVLTERRSRLISLNFFVTMNKYVSPSYEIQPWFDFIASCLDSGRAIDGYLLPVERNMLGIGQASHWNRHLLNSSHMIPYRHYSTGWANFGSTHATIVRDIIPDPFLPPVIMDPAWRTPDVLALANACYEQKSRYRMKSFSPDFSDRAVLADALEEAGCTSSRLLEHLRGEDRVCRSCSGEGCSAHGMAHGGCDGSGRLPPIHFHGCWAIDLVLGKT